MALGESLRLAREAKGQSISQVAESTRMMAQIVEDLEQENFRRIAAPIYGRGFIKLYAESLGLDPEPLLREFMEIYTGSRPPQVARRSMEEPLAAGPAVDLPDPGATERGAGTAVHVSEEPDLFSVAAGRSAAVCSIADPAQAGEAAPPRVRPAPGRPSLRMPFQESAPRQEPARLRSVAAGEPAASGRLLAGRWIPLHWMPAVIGLIAAVILVLLLVGVWALSRKSQKAHGSHSGTIKVQRIQKPAAPYFD
ncbi:MAG: helix-turn-helix domain-containing protein [bacterium]